MLALPPITSGQPLLDTIHHCDLLTLCAALPSQSVDMILCDLPYGTTACSWDSIIPLEPMWEQFKRVIKPRGAIVLTASQPFTSKLVMSNPEMFKYEWVWEKNVPTGFLNANIQPLKWHEDIVIFGVGKIFYYPQFRNGAGYKVKVNSVKSEIYGQQINVISSNDGTHYYPKDIVKINNHNGSGKDHPTQKPVALFEYLIRTYTQPGELVLDPCIGSGTTAIAARNTGRHFIGGDITFEYVELARRRLAKPYTPPLFIEASPATVKAKQTALFEMVGD